MVLSARMIAPRVATRFACDEDFVVADLLERLQAAGAVHGPVEARADELYLDTRTDELAAAGLSVRCREHVGVRTVELVVVPIDAAVPPTAPLLERAFPRTDELGDSVRGWVADRLGLMLSEVPREVLSLTIVRRRWAYVMNEVGVEIVIDEIAATEPHGRRARFTDLTVEAPDVAPGDVRRVVTLLGRVRGLELVRRSLFERTRVALGLGEFRYGSKPAPLEPDELLVDGARRVVAAWWANAVAHIPGVRIGLDSEHVHKMRVALRRVRTALRLFEHAFDPAALTVLRDRLRTMGRLLGVARDLDVQRAALGGWRARLPAVDDAAWHDLRERIDRRRHTARAVVVVGLDAEALREVHSALERCLAADVRGLRHTVGAVADGLLAKRAARCARALEKTTDGGAREAHALRIEVKNLRYSLDFLSEALGSQGQDLAERLSALQEDLGAVQDDVQAGELAEQLAAMAPYPSSATAFALGLMVGYARARGDSAGFAAQQAAAAHGLVEALAQLEAPPRTR